jgi:hypothetical protein
MVYKQTNKKISRRKEKMKKLLALMLMFTFAIVLVGCGGGTPDPTDVVVTGAREVKVGETIQLAAVVNPKGADQGVTYESLKPDLVSVDATGKVKGLKVGKTIIKVVSVKDPKIATQHTITVNPTEDIVRPDLGGYTIRIAQAGHALNETDPFHAEYKAQNKVAKQNAWNWVEEHYNVNIEVVAFPDDAEWGEPRWTYIELQAASNTADYDFYTVPDAQIGRFVEANAIIDITGWYAAYGDGYMDAVYKSSGSYKNSIYSITDGESGIYNVMYYNINLLNRLGLDKTPAQIFNDGDWTYSKFRDYAIEAQAKLSALSTPEIPYYAVAGNSVYYWAGMSNAGGVKLANVNTMKMDIKNETAIAAADTLKAIKKANAMDPLKQVDGGVASWMAGHALFSSGDLWFVNTDNRWPGDLWGEGDLTKYGYVPFPRPDGTLKENQTIGLGGTATWVMPIGRNYSGYTSELNAQNIYRAMVDAFTKTEEFQLSDPGYDEQALRRANAEKYAESEDSVQAFMYMAGKTREVGFFDPLSIPDNPVENTGFGALATAVNSYVMGTIETYAEAVDTHIALLQEKLTKAYS